MFSVSTDLDAWTSHKVQFGIPRLCFCKESEDIFHSKESFLVFGQCLEKSIPITIPQSQRGNK